MDKKARIDDSIAPVARMDDVKVTHAGEYMDVHGLESTQSQLTALRLEGRASRSEIWIRGVVHGVAAPNFTVLGLTVTTSPATLFPGGMSAAQFFASAAGRVAKVKGIMVVDQLAASEVELDGHGRVGADRSEPV